MPVPTVAEFRSHPFGNGTLNDTQHFGGSPDAAIEAKLDDAWRDFKRVPAGTILLAAHMLAVVVMSRPCD